GGRAVGLDVGDLDAAVAAGHGGKRRAREARVYVRADTGHRRALLEHRRGGAAVAVAHVLDAHPVTRSFQPDGRGQVLVGFDAFAVDGHDDIADLDAGFLGRGIRCDV